MAIDETKLTKGQVRKLNALRKSVGDELGEEVFGKWMVMQAQAAAKAATDPVAEKISQALESYVNDRGFRLGNYGYTIRRARGKGRTGFIASKNKKPD